MVHSESDKYKNDLLETLKKKFEGKLSDEELSFITGSYDRYMFEMIKLMKEGKSAHEKFFADIILNSIDAIVGFNNEDEVFLWNKGAEKIFGWTKDEMTGKNFSVIVPKELLDKGEIEYMRSKIKEQGFISNYETLRITKTGEYRNVSISRFVIFNDKEEIIGSVGIIRDITTEKNLEKELRDKENLALIGEVVSSIAHNISNPLNIISGNADYLLIDKKKDEEGYEELKIIVDETTRITKSIRQILNFARPLAPMRQETTMNEIVKDATAGFKFLIGEKPVELKLKLEKNPGSVKVDKEMFRDIIQNLLTNSVHAIPIDRNGVIEIKTSSENGFCSVKISDNGIGIPEKDVVNIFKPFYSTKGYGKGTGLGLAFTERVVKEHGGSISVSTGNGPGVSFVINLPLI
jgi:two-component system sensor histidine kinase HydH